MGSTRWYITSVEINVNDASVFVSHTIWGQTLNVGVANLQYIDERCMKIEVCHQHVSLLFQALVDACVTVAGRYRHHQEGV